MRQLLFGFSCAVFCVLTGCNSSGLVPVKGKVSFDNVPLEKGLVHFEAIDGKAASAKGGIIVNGEYSAEVPRGDLRVRITSSRIKGKKKANPDMPESKLIDDEEPIVPEQFNTKTTLKVTIDGRKDDLDFHLKK